MGLYLKDFEATGASVCSVLWDWHMHRDYDMISNNCQSFVLQVLNAMDVKLRFLPSVQDHIAFVAKNPLSLVCFLLFYRNF